MTRAIDLSSSNNLQQMLQEQNTSVNHNVNRIDQITYVTFWSQIQWFDGESQLNRNTLKAYNNENVWDNHRKSSMLACRVHLENLPKFWFQLPNAVLWWRELQWWLGSPRKIYPHLNHNKSENIKRGFKIVTLTLKTHTNQCTAQLHWVEHPGNA